MHVFGATGDGGGDGGSNMTNENRAMDMTLSEDNLILLENCCGRLVDNTISYVISFDIHKSNHLNASFTALYLINAAPLII